MNYGWIKLHRKLLGHPTFKDADRFQVFVYLLLRASFANHKISFNGRDLTLEPGQLISSRDAIALELGMHSSRVERLLKRLESEQQIEQQGLSTGRLITVINWGHYQSPEQASGQPANSQQTATEQPSNSYKKEEKNGENKIAKTFPRPPKGGERGGISFVQFWTDYPKKLNRLRAEKAWNALTSEEKAAAMAALPKAKIDEQWNRDSGQFIPQSATWLLRKSWLDDPKANYTPAKPKPPAPPKPPPPLWLDPLNEIRAIRKNKPNADALETFELLRIAGVLQSLPPEGWSDLVPAEYNYFKPIFRKQESAKQKRVMTLASTALPLSKESTEHLPEKPANPPVLNGPSAGARVETAEQTEDHPELNSGHSAHPYARA